MTTTTMKFAEYYLYSPYFAYTKGKEGAEMDSLDSRFDELSDFAQDLLLSEELAYQFKALIETGVLPNRFRAAVQKVLCYIAIGEIKLEHVENILIRLGLDKAMADNVVNLLMPTLELLRDLKDLPETPQDPRPLREPQQPLKTSGHSDPISMAPLPPLTTSKSVPVPPPPNRTTIDLRDKKLMP